MSDIIVDDKYVEITYKVTDTKTGDIMSEVEFPLAYVQGAESVLDKTVMERLLHKKVGDVITLPIDCDKLYGPRDEKLVFTDDINNVPEEYREVGMTITMENENGDSKNFIVTKVTDKSVTVDGNNPLCGREVVFELEVLSIRDATDEEIAIGGKVDDAPDLNEILSQ